MCTARLLTICPGGVCPGASAWGCLPRGVSANGVCVCPEDWCLPGGCLPHNPRDQRQTPPLWTDRHLWKRNLRKLRLRGVKKGGSSTYDVVARPEYATDSGAHSCHPTAEGHAAGASLQPLDDTLHLLTGRVPKARVNVATLCQYKSIIISRSI